jgi:hypothetical protein
MVLKKIDNIIDLSESFELLDKIRNLENCILSSKEFPSTYKIQLQPNDKGINFVLFYDSFNFKHDKWEFKDLEIKFSDLKIKVPYLYLTNKTRSQGKGKIPGFEYGSFNKNELKYHRLALPLKKQINFSFSLENISTDYYYKSLIHTREATEIVLNENQFLLIKKAKKNLKKK